MQTARDLLLAQPTFLVRPSGRVGLNLCGNLATLAAKCYECILRWDSWVERSFDNAVEATKDPC